MNRLLRRIEWFLFWEIFCRSDYNNYLVVRRFFARAIDHHPRFTKIITIVHLVILRDWPDDAYDD
jgi:hypothetical protein